jgi:Lon-like ATP-dependent protease
MPECQPKQLTRRERQQLERSLDPHDPADRDRGLLLYYNQDGSGPTAVAVPAQLGRGMVAQEAATESPAPSRGRQLAGLLIAALIMAYALLILQRPLLGLLGAGVSYVALARAIVRRRP